MSSVGIRRQLGPARKRLKDRLEEVAIVLGDADVNRLKQLRTQLIANRDYHEKLTSELSRLLGVVTNPDEITIIEAELLTCTELDMDANEICMNIDEFLSDSVKPAVKVDMIQQKECEKLECEIEKLKVETDCARAKLTKFGGDEGISQRAKLPQLTLPTFDGKVTDWPSFWDSFNATIHSCKGISKIDKFKYLSSCLIGEAKETLTGFNLTDVQYDQAIEHLKSRYDDKKYIIQTYYTSLSNLVKSSNVTSELRKTFNLIETLLRSLDCMGEQTENNYIISLIKSKLPNAFNLKLEETKDGEWTVKDLRKCINKLIVARERSEDVIEDEVPYEYTGEGLFNRDIKMKCIYCGKSHWSDECQLYKTLNERKGQLRGKCFVCVLVTNIWFVNVQVI